MNVCIHMLKMSRRLKKNKKGFTLRAFWWTAGLEQLYTALSDLMLSPARFNVFFLFLKEKK